MDYLNPTVTIQNTTSHYLVRFQHDFGNGEALDATISVPRGNHTLGRISQLALDRLAEMIVMIRPEA